MDEKSYIKDKHLGTLDPSVVDQWGDPTRHPETQLLPEQIDELMERGREVFLSHLTESGFPIVTVHLYCRLDGVLWSTTVKGRVKERAYRRDPRCSLCVSTTGLKLPFGGGICLKAHATVVEERDVVDRVCRAHAQRYYAKPETQAVMHQLLFTPNRVAIRFDVLKTISWKNIGMRQA